MAIFFKTTENTDKYMLHRSIRDHIELVNVVEKVEHEIINFYTQRPSIPRRFRSGRENLYTNNTIYVRLIGYDEENPDESDERLKTAMKRTIAYITSWVLRNYDADNKVGSISQGDRSITYIGAAPTWDQFPDGWQSYLKNFDNREAVYSI